MPALDYVSIIRSVYGDRRAMLLGTFTAALAAALTAHSASSPALALVTLAFVSIGLFRYADMRAFWRASIDSDDAPAAEYWENRAVLSGGLLALVYGIWCFVSMAVVRDPFAAMASAALSIAAMVGICARNFGLDRLVTIQLVLVTVPLAAGYALHGGGYYIVLAGLLGVMLSSFRKLAGDIRAILLSAVHGRIEASRLAAELDMAMSTLEHGLCMLDEAGVVCVVNERAVRLFARLGAPKLMGNSFAATLTDMGANGHLPRMAVDRLLDLITRRQSGKVLLSLPKGLYYEVTVSARLERCVLLLEDISSRVSSEERIHFMARHDALTGLPNRTYFGELAAEHIASRRSSMDGAEVALMIIDVDDFKHVNDTFGHIVGDHLLRQVAQRLRATVPVDAILARLGGDEFVVYRGAIADTAQANSDAQALLEAFATPFELDGMVLHANVSIGLVTSSNADDGLDDLMTKADLALYSAKGDGKARSQIFHAQMDIDYHYRQRLKADLREAVQHGGLTLTFQPLVDIATRKVVACEALARWDHPELGLVAPSTFIPLAEEMGLISQITEWVIGTAIEQCSAWPGAVSVAVNISARDFRGADLMAVIEEALARCGLAPSRLEIEVTETAVIEEHDIAKRLLTALAAKGVAIALDDFGTGYSSLSYLHALPFTKLKIDRSFVADIASDEKSLQLLANVARPGRDLDLIVVAEGVETEAQLDRVLEHTKVQQVQGYFFSRPLPARDIAELIGRLNAPRRLVQANRRHG
jgi:diguanylate cyclase (GGDEF)-like protein